MNHEFLRLREVADHLRVTVRTIYRMVADGQLPPPLKIRGRAVMPADAVRTYLDRLTRLQTR